jgi:long-subunit fatty acid transport protein
MRHIITIVAILLLPFLVKGQEINDLTDIQTASSGIFSAVTPVNNPFLPFSTSLSTGFTFGNLYSGNYFQSSINPAIIFPVNKRLSVSTGLTYSYTRLNEVPFLDLNSGSVKDISTDLNTLTISASGLYRINDKLHMTGSVYKTLNPSFNARLNPEALQMEAKGVSVGFGYQLNEKTFIGAELRMEQGNSNFYNPYNSPFDNSNSLFNRNSYFPGFRPF